MTIRSAAVLLPCSLALSPSLGQIDASPMNLAVLEIDGGVGLLDDLSVAHRDLLASVGLGCDVVGQPVGAVQVSTETDDWSAPASYYSGVTGTGAAVVDQLRSAMTAGHIQRRYGDFRYSAVIHDADPAVPGNILLAYNVASVRAQWDSGATWNREHVWPQSRQPGDASNSTRGNLGDPHALRPCNPSVNGSRSNKPFGFGDTTGSFRSLGSYYFPGDVDKGPIARSLFYSSGRYGLQLVDGFPSGNQMGDLASFVEWHYLEKPSEFERRRNHTIYSSAFNPSYFTNNRNAFVDMPGSVWAVFRDNFNDAQLWVGDAPFADGGSWVELCEDVIVGTDPRGIELSLNRSGVDGVYYAVMAEGDAITDQPFTNGFTDTFAIDDSAPRPIVVGVDPGVISGAGLYTGEVWIDNLDMTDGLGAGFGALDADDQIVVTANVFDPSTASFEASSVVGAVTLNFGAVQPGSTPTISLPLHALESTPGFTAGSAVTLMSSMGDADAFDIVLSSGVVEAGQSQDIVLTATPDSSGNYSVTYELVASDDPGISGAADRSVLSITLTANAGAATCVADVVAPFGVLDLDDIDGFIAGFSSSDFVADIAPPFGVLDLDDINAFIASFLAGCP